MGASDPLPAGYVIWFGSLDFVATDGGHGTDILPSGANPDTPTPPSRRGRRPRRHAPRVRMARRGAARLPTPTWVEASGSQSGAATEDAVTSPSPTARTARPASPTWDEAGRSQPGAVAEDVTASPPPTAATVPSEEGATVTSPLPSGTHTPAATHTSSVSTNVSAHEDLPGYRFISIHDLAAPPLGSSYPDSSDEGYVFVRERIAPDFSGVRDCEALLAFQAAADYCFACSDDSSEDYDLAQKFSMVELAERGNDAANDTADSPTNRPVEPPTNSAAPRAATPTNHAQN